MLSPPDTVTVFVGSPSVRIPRRPISTLEAVAHDRTEVTIWEECGAIFTRKRAFALR